MKDYSWHKFAGDVLAGITVGLVTFALTVVADLTVAVEARMIPAALVRIRKVAATTTVPEFH